MNKGYLLPFTVFCFFFSLQGNLSQLNDYYTFTVNQIAENYWLKQHKQAVDQEFKGLNIVILGQSWDENNEIGFNEEVLKDLLQLIQVDQPKAVFFNGNLIYSLVKSEVSTESEKLLEFPAEKNIFGNRLEKEEGFYSSQAFSKALEKFKALLLEYLGEEIPFYPLVGRQEAIGPDIAEVFQQQFDLKNALILDSNQLVYTVPIGNALFIALSTDYYQKDEKTPQFCSISPSAWTWLEETLKSEGDPSSFIFVVGSDPAFSTSASFDLYQGLDKEESSRNRFWRLLKDRHVNCYFSGGETLYDRSYRYGLWQVITGGAGALLSGFTNKDETFFHYVLLRVPQKPSKDPIIQTFDRAGDEQDKFTLSKHPPALYNLRISKQP